VDAVLQRLRRAVAEAPDDEGARRRLQAELFRVGYGWHEELVRPDYLRADTRREGVYTFRSPVMAFPIEMVYVRDVAQNTPFYIARYHTTRRDYAAFCRATNRQPPMPTDFDEKCANEGENLQLHPVVMVTIDDARDFCRWAGLVLPTVRQWEIAARGGSEQQRACGECRGLGTVVQTEEWPIDAPRPTPPRTVVCPTCRGAKRCAGRYPWGNESISDERAVTARHTRYGYWLHSTAAIGTLDAHGVIVPARPAGRSWCEAFDLIGNAAQWVEGAPPNPPQPPGTRASVVRPVAVGGSYQRAEDREATPTGCAADVGFRVCLPIER